VSAQDSYTGPDPALAELEAAAREMIVPGAFRDRIQAFRRVPLGWRREQLDDNGAGAQWRSRNGLVVIESVLRYGDGRLWHHVSYSRAGRLPDHADTLAVRRAFIGESREAYSVWPPRARYVNEHPFCLHLWACLDAPPDGAVLPDFRIVGTV
jgi:hypothetical protein